MQPTDEMLQQLNDAFLKALKDHCVMRVGFELAWTTLYSRKIPESGKAALGDVFMLGCAHAFQVMDKLIGEPGIAEDEGYTRMNLIAEELTEFMGRFRDKYVKFTEEETPAPKAG